MQVQRLAMGRKSRNSSFGESVAENQQTVKRYFNVQIQELNPQCKTLFLSLQSHCTSRHTSFTSYLNLFATYSCEIYNGVFFYYSCLCAPGRDCAFQACRAGKMELAASNRSGKLNRYPTKMTQSILILIHQPICQELSLHDQKGAPDTHEE